MVWFLTPSGFQSMNFQKKKKKTELLDETLKCQNNQIYEHEK